MTRQPPTGGTPALLVLADGSVQDDLFGQVEAELAARAETARRRAEFETRTRLDEAGSSVWWVAPYDCPTARRGEQVPGRRCWLCGDVVVNTYVLASLHGLDADDPHCLDRTACLRQSCGGEGS